MIGQLTNIANALSALLKKLTPQGAQNLNDNLDAPVSSRLAHDNAMLFFDAVLAKLEALTPITGSQTFSDPGAFEFTVPDGVSKLIVTMIGAGAGGVGLFYTNSGLYGASGGGSGAAIFDFPMTVTSGDVIAGSVGAGGLLNYVSGSQTSGAGRAGGNTTFGGLAVNGGRGGTVTVISGGTNVAGVGGAKPTMVSDLYGFAGGTGLAGSGGSTKYAGGVSPISPLFPNVGAGGSGGGSLANNSDGLPGIVVLRWE